MSRQDVRNAAIILLSLPEEDAAAMLRALGPEHLELVAREIAGIDSIGCDEQRAVMRCFTGDPETGNSETNGSGVRGGSARAERLVRLALGAGEAGLIRRLRQEPLASSLATLERVSNRALAGLLADERCQTIAAVLAHLPTRRVAEILEDLRPEQRLGVIHRMAAIEPVSAELIREVVSVLAERAARDELQRAADQSWPLAS